MLHMVGASSLSTLATTSLMHVREELSDTSCLVTTLAELIFSVGFGKLHGGDLVPTRVCSLLILVVGAFSTVRYTCSVAMNLSNDRLESVIFHG